jgi:putative flavoprotein involved in K+ transport
VEQHDVVVIGAGQAGLTMSRMLGDRGIEHVVLERDRVAERWRTSRWDSLRFQFPNHLLSLPGQPYDGPDPEGFCHHTEVLGFLERYAARAAPVRENTSVLSVDRDRDRWRLETTRGVTTADAVVMATGPFQRARIPDSATRLPPVLAQVHSVDYRHPSRLPDGAVLVVGSGASGAQIAEELVAAGRRVYLSVSRHRRVPRRIFGRDVTDWLVELGFMDRTRADWVEGRMPPTVLVTGVGGGHDLDLRALAADGAVLLGTLLSVDDGVLTLADDAEPLLADADRLHDELIGVIADRVGATAEVHRPTATVPTRPRLSLSEAGITSVIWATGYDFDYSWLHAPCLDARGAPIQLRGVTDVPGLYFLGLHWMHTIRSGTFLGIGDDAAYVADHLIHHLRS